MDILPSFTKNEGIPTVSFGNMPVWNGVQRFPGVQKCLAFELSAYQGPIMQRISPQIISDVVEAYKKDEYSFITPPPGSSEWANSIGQSKVNTVERVFSDGSPRDILEIGAGSTWVAQRLRARYHPESYLIIDPSIRETAEGIEIHKEYFPNQKIVDRRFDLILGFSVLEHVSDPLLFLRNVKRHLAKDGIVILVFPDCEAQLRRGEINVLIHEHISYFTEASSRWLAATMGFEIKSIESKNDCFTLVLQHQSKDEPYCMPVLNESELLLHSVTGFSSLLKGKKNTICEWLDDGQSIGFHGATNGLNAFLHMTGIGGHPNIHIYDGDISKQGLYVPACSTPILSTMDSSYSKNTMMVISAMSFADQITMFAVNNAGLDEKQLLPLVGI